MIPAREVVPGHVLLLESGDKVPADALLIEALNLQVDESPLTGESLPVTKKTGPLEGVRALAERTNMIHMGTTVTRGRGKRVVMATGMNTEMGRIAALLQETEAGETPLQRRMAQLGGWLVLISLGICGIMMLIGICQREDMITMFLAGVSLVVAAVPEGLPAVVTVCLALGVRRMAQKKAIVRKLPAVETLGCVTAICTDKTGTLTLNQMTVKSVWAEGRTIEVTGTGYSPRGEFLWEEKKIKPEGG